MKYEYLISEKDFIAAAKLAGKGYIKIFYYTPIIFLIVRLSYTYLFVEGANKKSYGEDILLFLFICILVMVSVLFLKFIFNPIIFRWSYRKNKHFSVPLTLEINSDGLRFEQEDSVFNLKWDRVHKWKEDAKSLIVYSQPFCYHIIPKRLVADGFEFDPLLDALRNQLPPNKSRK